MRTESFDEFADDYDEALAQGISVSGESKEFFARQRVDWLSTRLRQLGEAPRTVLDFGCGTGATAPILLALQHAESVLGVDASTRSIERARTLYGNHQGVTFLPTSEYVPDGRIDLAFCNGVFHHIPVDARDNAVRYVYDALRPSGLFALWENNPWNPGTRLVMSRIPFDRDAVTLNMFNARQLVQSNGFEILRVDFMFIFPHALRRLRWIEPHVARFPLGSQYQVLCRKPMLRR